MTPGSGAQKVTFRDLTPLCPIVPLYDGAPSFISGPTSPVPPWQKDSHVPDLVESLGNVFPAPVEARVRDIHRRLIFRWALWKFTRNPSSALRPGSQVLSQLVYG